MAGFPKRGLFIFAYKNKKMTEDGIQGNKDDKKEGPINIEKQRVNGLGLVG